jgi:hypothetical protein
MPDDRLERIRRDPLRWVDRALALVLIGWIGSFTFGGNPSTWLGLPILVPFAIGAIFPLVLFRSGRWGMVAALMLVLPHFGYYHVSCDIAAPGPTTDRLHIYHDLFIYVAPYVLTRTVWLWVLYRATKNVPTVA